MFNIETHHIFLIALLYVHISSIVFSAYYHRSIVHNAVTYSQKTEKIFKFIAWLIYPMNEFLLKGGHDTHHKYSDKPGDFMSPTINGWHKIMIYPIVKKIFGLFVSIIPFRKTTCYGKFIFLVVNFLIFGLSGIIIFFVTHFLLYFFGNFVFDGLAHLPHVGYTNYKTNDNSRNIFPIGVLFAGEELHNNHHFDPTNVKFSRKWFEFDITYMYIKLLEKFNLATIQYAKNKPI